MYTVLSALLLFGSIYSSHAGYGIQPSGTAEEDFSQSDIETPAYVPSYLKHQKNTKTSYSKTGYSGAKTGYSGTKTGYAGTKTGYSGTKTGYSGTKTGYSGTKTGYSGTKTGYTGTKTGYTGMKTGHGGSTGYTETKTWHSSSGSAPSFEEFHSVANEAYTAQCTPECKNNGICVDTNTCHCPSNYRGRYCEFERKPCLAFPPLPLNSARKCTADLCTITCAAGHKFPDGTSVADLRCAEGQWRPARADLTTLADCEPRCTVACLNGGVCLAVDTCQCGSEFRGPQCQYDANVCDVRKLAFNGAYSCSGDGDGVYCKLSCPVEATYSTAPAELYTCTYATGQFTPQPIPHCVFNQEVIVVTPSNYHHSSYYEYHTSNYSSGAHSIVESQSQMEFGHQKVVYGQSGQTSYGHSQSGQGTSYGNSQSGQSTSYGNSQSGQSTSYGHSQSGESGHIPTSEQGQIEGSFENKTTFEQNLTGEQGHGKEYYANVKIVVQDMTPKGGVCLTWAGVHYKTFDGKIYSFESPCQHILVRDPREHKYTVAVKMGKCERQAYCPAEITIYLEDKPYVLAVGEEGAVTFKSGRRAIPIPAALPGIRVAMPADHVVVNLDSAGLTLKWDTNNIIIVEGSVLLWNNTEGLCGSLDGNAENDLATKEGAPAQTKAVMAASWQLHNIGEVCESNPAESSACAAKSEEDVKAARRFCGQVFSKDKFRKCSKVMDVTQLLETCQWDYCACISSQNAEDCACSTVSVYARECLRHGVEEMKGWRDDDTCPMKCPSGKVYNPCGPDTQPSCAFPSPSKDNATCVEGCFCPKGLLLEGGKCVSKEECPCRLRNKSFLPGASVSKDCNTCTCQSGEWTCTSIPCGARCSAMGDPHYTTFDGLRYDFMGHCTYNMLQTDNLTVEVENVACSGAITEAMNLPTYKGKGNPSCTKAVNVNYGPARIHLKQGGYILVNGKEVSALPVVAGGVKIRAASSLFVVVQMPNKVDLWWDGNTRVYIDVPAGFHDKTKGLCGTFNLNQLDDFLTPEGDVEQSALAFANKWKTREFCDDVMGEEPEHPCKANVQNKEVAEKYCGRLKGKLFEECHWHVDVTPYYEACLYDMCACAGDAARCLCPVLGHYATQCADQGVKVQWRYNVKECELSCSGGQEYTVCADSCQRTCADAAFAAGKGGDCRPSCVEGCACPPPQVLNNDGVCVPVGLCPCYHKGLTFAAGYSEVRPGRRERELCTCIGAAWECRPASDADILAHPPADDVRLNCSAARHMQFSSCLVGEPLTCKNMHLPPSTTSAECRPGCQCVQGHVLDSASGQCVPRAACPCHHGGRSYADGHVMQEGCNSCECKSGNWSCSTLACAGVCAAWGDSHVVTFDGTEYDFEGVCTYMLAKGMMDGKDGFSVEIQNVPCGTTGATCSKSVTLRVGSGHEEEVASLTRDAVLPDLSQLKRIKLRVAGAFVFLDVPSMGVSLQWDRGLRVYVKVNSMWQGRVRGLCGNYNGDQRDDFQSPSGGLPEASALLFADSWKMRPTCPRPTTATDHCMERRERKEWAVATCGALKRYPFTLCHSEVPPGGYVERCERDACACDAGGDCACACAALAAYAHHCARRGVHVAWRTNELCPLQCDEECSNYDACVSACPLETCDNTLYYTEIKAICEQDTCVEGCKPKKSCSEGSVYTNDTLADCVPRTKCRPTCMTLADGTPVLEGEVLEEDACHTCRCSKGHRVCIGQPCPTDNPQSRDPAPSTLKPHDEPLKCVSGWTGWLSRGTPETSGGDSVEKEPLPKLNELIIGSPMCKPEQMKEIECRTTTNHLTAKATGLNVECSLEKGLLCKEKKDLCPDFEIRVRCECGDEPFQCLNSEHPNHPHPTDCTKFYECTPDPASDKPHAVLKSCPEGLMYHDRLMVCDWPAAVVAARPQCGDSGKEPASTSPSTESSTTTTISETKTTSICPPGQVYMECAYECSKLCDHFKKTLLAKEECSPGQKCVKGCVDEDVSRIKCELGSLWRDEKTCVPVKDCTCYSDDGGIVKPGGIKTDGCVKCQCLDNQLHCDRSECIAVSVPSQGVTHEAIFLSVPNIYVQETTTYIPIISTTHTLTTHSAIVAETQKTKPRRIAKQKSEGEAPSIIVISTTTPPPACSPDGYTNLLWDGEPLPDSAFNASSVVSALFEPQYAVLNGHPYDITAGSWNPAVADTNQYIQVTLPRREPIYAIIMQGSPLFDQYVTSYDVMYGDDGVTFSTVNGPDGQPKVFRGPVDHENPARAELEPPIEARVVRLRPRTWHEDIAVRFELVGCRQPAATAATPLPVQCAEPLGLAAELPLESIEVSSNNDLRRYFALDGDRGWRPVYSTPGEWIMFDFTSPRNITGIKTKGGPTGWVTSYNILYTSDLSNFNPVVDSSGSYKAFPANFDSDTVVVNEFRPPLHARYLKVLPLEWRESIEMRAEPIGCFEPYPVTQTLPQETTGPSPVLCELCPGIRAEHCECTSAQARHFDGDSCVTRDQCPCVESIMSYGVGSTFRGANCDECVCKLGGITDCKPIRQCACAPDLVPKLSPSSCECLCEPCPNGTRICPTSKTCLALEKWCDGLQDCPDDERSCTTTVTVEPVFVTTVAPTVAVTFAPVTAKPKEVKPVECPEVKCPPGYTVRYTPHSQRISTSELPPPRPRNTYARYYKGAKGGAKGGYAKGGYSKGGFTKTQQPIASQAFTLEKPTATTKPKQQIECVQFRCIPPLPPPYQGAAKQVCVAPTCPAGYSLTLDGVANDCPLYSCAPPPELPAWCNVTGRTFNTFDGAEYKYDVCFHILARENRKDSWTVLVRKKCRLEGCANELLVHQDDQLILVKPTLMIEYDNYEYTVEQTSKICFQKNSFDVHRIGNGLAVTSRKYNFTVLYNTDGDIKIGVFRTHLGSVDGLCGAFDGDLSNERRMPDGTVAASIDQFGRSWAKPGLPPNACQTKVISAERQERAWKLCDVITQEPISKCGKVLNLDKWRSICLEKICECTELVVNGSRRTEEECRCLLLDQLVAECLAGDKDLDLGGWRMKRGCPADCPPPLVHYDCYRRGCEPTCSASGATRPCELTSGVCFPGCFCPEGWLRRGDQCVAPQKCLDCACTGIGSPAKHVTFEGDDLPFLGNCTYLVSRDRNDTGQHRYEIYATNGPCEANGAAVCAKSLHILYGNNIVHITKDDSGSKLITTIDKVPVFQYPVNKDWITVTQVNGQDVTLELPEAQVELSVRLPSMEYTVRVPSYTYANRTEGLCGVCAGYLEHLVTSNGTVTDDLEEYGKSWRLLPQSSKLDIPAASCEESAQKACEPLPPLTNPCYQLYNADRFGACHPLVDPQPYVESCESELCALNNTDVCGVLARYAAECRRQAVCLDWRGDLCPFPCELPLVYRTCVTCERTCDNYDELSRNPAQCDKRPVEGCYCPEGMVRINDTCIKPTKCFPCDANKLHYAGDEWQEGACVKCSCSKLPNENSAHISCTTQSCAAPVCSDKEDLVTEPAKLGACCPQYACVPKQQASVCSEAKTMECGYGQVLKLRTTDSGCNEFACECKPRTECERIPSEDTTEAGMTRVIDDSGCCPRAQTVCAPEKCPAKPACPTYHEVVTTNVTGKCCPAHKCVPPKDKCIIDLEWEASPTGGEVRRTTPQVVLKDLEAHWKDGPCRSCECTLAGRSCRVATCAALTDKDYVLESRPVPFECCSETVRVGCKFDGRDYKAGENWTSANNACEQYQCVESSGGQVEKITTVQACRTDCEQGWQYTPPEDGACCGQCRPEACAAGSQLRAVGEHWTSPDHCTNYTCGDVNGTLQVQSTDVVCPEVPEATRKLYVVRDETLPGKCCAKHELVACRNGNDIYQEGQTWPTSDPCKNVTCARDAAGSLSHVESIQTCAAECKRGWVYTEPDSGVCCGRCEQTACVVDDQLKEPGATWQSADNCTTYSCERIGDDLSVTSSRQACADVTNCKPEDIVDEGCCQVCREKASALSTCVPQPLEGATWTRIVRVRIGKHGVCVNDRPIDDFRECRGTCHSGTLYNNQTGLHESVCSCCQAVRYVGVTARLRCEDGTRQPHRLASPAACACRACGGDAAAAWPAEQSDQQHPSNEATESDQVPEMYHRFGTSETPHKYPRKA